MPAPTDTPRHALRLSTDTAESIGTAADLAVTAEQAGWEGVFVSDSILFGFADPWPVLGAIAARTESVVLGTWLTPVPQLQPWRTAHTLAALDQLSGGRVLLGSGLGVPEEHRRLGLPAEGAALGRKYDESLEIITRLWRGETLDFEGEFFTLDRVTLPVTPAQQPRIPIVLGSWWPHRKAFRRAATWDGVMPYWPALLGDGSGPQGEKPTGASVEDELREMLTYYHGLRSEPGEIVLPLADRSEEYLQLCQELGATWLVTEFDGDVDAVRRGPPN